MKDVNNEIEFESPSIKRLIELSNKALERNGKTIDNVRDDLRILQENFTAGDSQYNDLYKFIEEVETRLILKIIKEERDDTRK
jgi:hypothetical protein